MMKSQIEDKFTTTNECVHTLFGWWCDMSKKELIVHIICRQNCLGWCNGLSKSHERSRLGMECEDCMDCGKWPIGWEQQPCPCPTSLVRKEVNTKWQVMVLVSPPSCPLHTHTHAPEHKNVGSFRRNIKIMLIVNANAGIGDSDVPMRTLRKYW